jgi:hypothetical protein
MGSNRCQDSKVEVREKPRLWTRNWSSWTVTHFSRPEYSGIAPLCWSDSKVMIPHHSGAVLMCQTASFPGDNGEMGAFGKDHSQVRGSQGRP